MTRWDLFQAYKSGYIWKKKRISVILHINRIKKIIVHIYLDKSLDKMHHSFKIKMLSNIGI